MVTLPKEYFALEELLSEMPFSKSDGTAGLLRRGELGAASTAIPEYDLNDIQDTRLLSALFRDYTFWASSYLLEPCHLGMLKNGEYGLGRDILPRNIAVPLDVVARKLGMKPFMEYALSYALYNWKRNDIARPIAFDNLELIRKFTGMSSEAGFILVHVAMVAHSHLQVKATFEILEAARGKDRPAFNEGLRHFLRAMQLINGEMETMWSRSNPDDYKEFRTFIMGIKNQPMFPNGVKYEGVSDNPVAYRGESGANDSIIPTADNLFQLYEKMPENELTEILRDFRTYRPLPHNAWLTWVQERAQDFNIREYALKDSDSAVLYLANVDQIREFRQRHWNFTKEYIIKHTDHPVATGGSPIVTWLPNQLGTVLQVMKETVAIIDRGKLRKDMATMLGMIEKRMESQDSILEREVSQLQQKISRGGGGGGGEGGGGSRSSSY